MSEHVVIEKEIGGRTLRLETGKWAKQADSAVFATYGETSVLAAVVRGTPREGIDFFPLQVDYRERLSAAGKFPGGFRKREGAPSTKEILTMRMIDRPVRPLFPKGFYDEVVIQCWVESADGQNEPDVLAGTAAAAALAISSLPFDGPVATVRVGRVEEQFAINPTAAQMEYSDMELVLSGHREGVNMIEVGASQVEESVVLEAIKFGHEQIFTILDAIDELTEKAGKEKVADLDLPSKELEELVTGKLSGPLAEAKRTEGKQARYEAVKAAKDAVLNDVAPEPTAEDDLNPVQYKQALEKRKMVKLCFEKIEEDVTRGIILEGTRTDGRSNDELRPLHAEVGILARPHGSAVFTRGETQSMATATLGTGRDEQVVDGLGEEYSQKFYLHYNFPPFCVGEARRISGPSRREIGHGSLAEKSLAGIMPSPDDFPYTVRVISEILESNGSSSMASICAGCLAMMDAGVPITDTCAGISIGMVEEDGKRLLLTDILGEEDHFGDMDFKVAGTRSGITGIQLDLKRRGVDYELIEQVFEQARQTRLQIIDFIEGVIPEPRKELSPHAPRMLTTKISPDKIGALIGPGGKTIRAIQETTGASIDVEEDGTVFIAAVGGGKAEAALSEVERLCEEVKEGKIYTGKVSTIKDFGAFVEVVPGKDGLLHISEISHDYVGSVGDVLKVGQELEVKVLSIDDQGRLRLSRKVLLEAPSGEEGDGGNGGSGRGGRRDKSKDSTDKEPKVSQS
ncbi:MAG: polyribonucleotide nucleotidyltransferase [Phycisphaeraceae bacterium]|nr:polyribonucleotide nucleotidyltransferase [Phycisphaeraceae bacterium]